MATEADCAAGLAEHRADPTLEVDTLARARNSSVVRVPRGSWRVRLVVDENGRVDPALVTVTPTPPDLEEMRYQLSRSTYFPARVGGCPVPSVHTFRLGF